MIGDVVGKPGRRAVKTFVPELRKEHKVDFVIANGENSAGGYGITVETAEELIGAGVDVITTGNHVWDQKEIIPHLDGDLPLLRPINFPPGEPGRGYMTSGKVMVVNLVGRVFMGQSDCPFRAMESLLSSMTDVPPIVFLDFHTEATSEIGAMGWYMDGRASAVVGTHTHVGTVDAQILPRGTAFLSDVGMVGPIQGVIGDDPQTVLSRFLSVRHSRLSVAKGPVRFNSVMVDVNDTDGKATSIQRIDMEMD
jgi:metallophosphoesterase (TIGR00282 family)